MYKYAFALTCAAVLANPAVAQQATSPAVAVVQAEDANVLRVGTEVTLEMREELTTKGKKLKPGRRIQMATVGDVVVNGMVVIPSGTPAIGEITEVRNKGMWGKSGYIGAKAVSLNLNGRQIRLTGMFDDKGVTGTGGVIASVALVPVVGFFVTGTSAVLPMGGQVKGFIDENVPFGPAAAPSAPMPIQAAPAAAATAQPAMRADLPAGVTCTTCQK